jgi:hypothetical protein
MPTAKPKTTKPKKANPRRFISDYLNEVISYGGEPFTRADAIRDMQNMGMSQVHIDRWLQGYELGERLRAGRNQTALTPQP